MHRFLKLGVAAFAFVAAVPNAGAFIWTFNGQLTGAQEVPPNASPVIGHISGTYDDALNMIMFNASAGEFSTAITASHFHAPGGLGVAAPVIITLGLGSGGPYQYTQINQMAIFTDQQEAWLLSGLVYINVHTQQFPGGEVRSQINLVPEPASVIALLGGALFAIRRRMKRN